MDVGRADSRRPEPGDGRRPEKSAVDLQLAAPAEPRGSSRDPAGVTATEEDDVAPIVSRIEVGRPPHEVYAYVTDPSRFGEWQGSVVSGRMEDDRPPAVGSRFTTITRIGGAEQTSTLEITEISPPRSWAVRGVDGPVRVMVSITVEPLDADGRSRITITLDFEGHGVGKALVPLVVRPQAAKEAPKSCQRLKDRLEASG